MREGVECLSSLEAGFAEFYQASYRRLAVQVYAYVGSAAEAEDAVQEAFLRAWRRWSVVSRYDDPVAWVRRVAWNLATGHLRRVMRAARVLRRHRRAGPVAVLGPDHVALVAALRRLPHRHRQVIVMHYIADMSVAEHTDGTADASPRSPAPQRSPAARKIPAPQPQCRKRPRRSGSCSRRRRMTTVTA